jgi:hypothetical protein
MSQRNFGFCCLCIPLQAGTQILTAYTFLYSFFCIVALLSGDIRLLDAGYNKATSRLSAMVGCLGCAFGLIGMIGVANSQVLPLRIYNGYQVLKLAALVYVCVMDIVALRNCATYSKSIYSQVEFNAPMEALSMKGLCVWGYHSYIIGSIVRISAELYFTYVTYIYGERLASNPNFLINFGNELGMDGVVPWQNTRISEGTRLLVQEIRNPKIDAELTRQRAETVV